ncbi:LacI family DNA-binding transcriptional regulator [Klebsiella oxytoca]|uniref:LacI family DNA-binding transcriptional regulator n=1 Tax=Klebsiella oxytoca TaxID=571 RepID=UPI001D0D0FDB|nr:LacI family DNA-binding transcriptional regulator [Klebsiella oxytoca]
MPTIKDIAKIAGVSHGTVSNVLNGRGNVSVEKIEAVQRAAKEVGYQLNAQAQSLRASKSRGWRCCCQTLMRSSITSFTGAYIRSVSHH